MLREGERETRPRKVSARRLLISDRRSIYCPSDWVWRDYNASRWHRAPFILLDEKSILQNGQNGRPNLLPNNGVTMPVEYCSAEANISQAFVERLEEFGKRMNPSHLLMN